MAAYYQEMSFEEEWAQENELAGEFTAEAGSHEQESENEDFFNNLASMGERSGKSRALRRIALAAARSALRGRTLDEPGRDGELGEYEGLSAEAAFLEATGLSPEMAMLEMEHLGHAAAEAESEQEAAEQFLPLIALAGKALLPVLAKKALPFAMKMGSKVLPQLARRVSPQLSRGIGNITRTLYQHPASRRLIRAVPRIARGTMLDVLRRYSQGGRIDPAMVSRLLAGRTAQVLSNPTQLARTWQRSASADARYHSQHGGNVPASSNGGICRCCGR